LLLFKNDAVTHCFAFKPLDWITILRGLVAQIHPTADIKTVGKVTAPNFNPIIYIIIR